ncbi:Hypothetical predicted protein [Scomber scombrus]|uniref:Uncharacterized protein n=1 Tax=Scomber scombrus TaxID=13677 RepID=A0AAV1MQU1_SCOSC
MDALFFTLQHRTFIHYSGSSQRQDRHRGIVYKKMDYRLPGLTDSGECLNLPLRPTLRSEQVNTLCLLLITHSSGTPQKITGSLRSVFSSYCVLQN